MVLFCDYCDGRLAGGLSLDQSLILPYFLPEDATFSESAQDLVHQYGDMVSALLYSTVFFPEFVEVEDSVLLKTDVPDFENQFRSGKLEAQMTLAALEASFNSIEVAYLFSNRRSSIDDSDCSEAIEHKLAKIIADSWRLRLKDLYPSRVFSVSVLTAEESESVISVEFFEIR
jgi:hypothetical protein